LTPSTQICAFSAVTAGLALPETAMKGVKSTLPCCSGSEKVKQMRGELESESTLESRMRKP